MTDALNVQRGYMNTDPKPFDMRRERCSRSTREVIDFLKSVAENAGPDVEAPTFEARGIGVTYSRNGQRFCRFDPKPRADHVWALVPGGDRAALKRAGAVSDREDGPWVAIKNMHGAVRLVPEILRAYDAVSSGGRRTRSEVGP